MGENATSFFYLAVIFLAAAEMYREVWLLLQFRSSTKRKATWNYALINTAIVPKSNLSGVNKRKKIKLKHLKKEENLKNNIFSRSAPWIQRGFCWRRSFGSIYRLLNKKWNDFILMVCLCLS